MIVEEEGLGYSVTIGDENDDDSLTFQNDYYVDHIDTEHEGQSKEEARILYVAMTRAKKQIAYIYKNKKRTQNVFWRDVLGRLNG